MKKALIFLVAIGVAAAVLYWAASRAFSWVWAGKAVADSASQQWPGGMGTLASVADRFPPRDANAACVKLRSLATALPKNETIGDFVAREIARGELAIAEAPALPDLSAIRELLLRDPIVWSRHGGIGDEETTADRVLQMTVARSLVASALAKARAHDSAAWEDLSAVRSLGASLDAQPQMMTQTAAFSMARMINAVAWKMPLPAPAWLAELQQRDWVPRLLEAFQYQVASYWRGQSRVFPTKWLAASVERDHRIAQALFEETRCDVTAEMNDLGVDLSPVWRRAFRFRAEREASANALRVRQGRPIETASRCSDGAWTFDGTTLRFSKAIAPISRDPAMPLVLRVTKQSLKLVAGEGFEPSTFGL